MQGFRSMKSLVAAAAVVVAALMAMSATAWMPSAVTTTTTTRSRSTTMPMPMPIPMPTTSQLHQRKSARRLFMAGDEVAAEETETSVSASVLLSFLEDTEWKIIEDLHDKASKTARADSDSNSDSDSDSDEEEAFQKAAEALLPALSPALIMKLRSGDELIPSGAGAVAVAVAGVTEDGDDDDDAADAAKLLAIFSEVSRALNTMTDRRLESARDTLEQLMNAGEIKKLDALIGKSARERRLDVAFFQVLQMNLRDAAEESQKEAENGEGEGEGQPQSGGGGAVDRFQILQHIYTRCQEEVEKTINPGTALLNKLLRTEVDSIRRNQLDHYLCPAATTITSPDGKEIVLNNNNNGQPAKPLVAHHDFCDAIGNAIKQIRTVETSGAATPEVAADLVESIRIVAKEARIVIGEHFGGNSTEVVAFEDALEPVFRPTSPDSPYIRGEQPQPQSES